MLECSCCSLGVELGGGERVPWSRNEIRKREIGRMAAESGIAGVRWKESHGDL